MVIAYVLTVIACHYGLGRYDYYVTPEDRSRALLYTFVFGHLGLWSSTLVRISVAFMLLRFNPSRSWHIVLWTTIAFQILATIGANIAVICQCSPVRANWDIVPEARCVNQRQMEIMYGFVIGEKKSSGYQWLLWLRNMQEFLF
jgi:hypothetical protein